MNINGMSSIAKIEKDNLRKLAEEVKETLQSILIPTHRIQYQNHLVLWIYGNVTKVFAQQLQREGISVVRLILT
jgi:hypothetical protein